MKALWVVWMWPVLLFAPCYGWSQDPNAIRDSIEFHEILRSHLPVNMRDNINLSMIHMIPNQELSQLPLQKNLVDAMNHVGHVKLANLIANNRVTPAARTPAITREVITLVIVPGFLNEFISSRAFEEIIGKDSAESASFEKTVRDELKKGNPNSFDIRFDSQTLSMKAVALSEVLRIGVLTDDQGQLQARLVVFTSAKGSSESISDLGTQAEIFNRRLGKYTELSGAKNMVVLGYSWGAATALEMLKQANQKKLPWLGEVKALVSWAGVIWGTGAVDGTQPVTLEAQKLLQGLDAKDAVKNKLAWDQFVTRMQVLVPELSQGKSYPDVSELAGTATPINLDAVSVANLVLGWGKEFEMDAPVPGNKNLNPQVLRFRKILDHFLSTLPLMTMSSREAWWAASPLPPSVTYYSLSAAMANPALGHLDREAFTGNWGYSQKAYDDLLLLQSRIDHEAASGVSLNDGQVNVAQSIFLPELSATLNSANKNLKTVMLGTCGTHHWGMAFANVNEMKNHRINPFPREVLLKTLIEKISKDGGF